MFNKCVPVLDLYVLTSEIIMSHVCGHIRKEVDQTYSYFVWNKKGAHVASIDTRETSDLRVQNT